MSKFLHRDAIDDRFGRGFGQGRQSFNAAERLGIRWPELPWTCPGCGHIYENHGETVATVDLELAVFLAEVLNTAPAILATPRLGDTPKTRAAIEAFVDYLRADMAEHGPPAAFACIPCDGRATGPGVQAVHGMHEGVTPCSLRIGELPAGHRWVRMTKEERDLITCLLCKQIIAKGGAPCPD